MCAKIFRVTWAYERDDKAGRNERKLREIEREKEKEKERKAEFTHPVSTCIYCIAIFDNLLWFCLVSIKKLQCNVDNACGNWMCKRALNKERNNAKGKDRKLDRERRNETELIEA